VVSFSNNHKYRWFVSCLLFFVLFFIFSFKVNLSNKINVQFGSDEWDYQTIAVNFACGHGFHVTGSLEKPEVYKFGNVDNGTYEKLELLKGITDIHRPPLYPLFIGLVYKLFGVNPYLIVIFQLLLLCIVAAGLPLLGYFLWQNKGFYSGIISGVIFIIFNYRMADVFLPGQAFTVFWIFIFIYIAEKFLKAKTPLWAALMGFVFALSLLFHATMILVVGFIGIYLLLDFKNGEKWAKTKNLLAFCVVVFVTLLPWHLFAFKTLKVLKHDASVVLSIALDTTLTFNKKTQQIAKYAPKYGQSLMPQKEFTDSEIKKINDSLIPDVKNKGTYFNNIKTTTIDFYKIALSQEIIDAPDYFPIILSSAKNWAMDCHNEYINKGYLNPEWRYNANSFYNNDNLKNRNSFIRVYSFYKNNPKLIFILIYKKINVALNRFGFIKYFFVLFIFYHVLFYLISSGIKKYNILILSLISVLFFILLISYQHNITPLLLMYVCGLGILFFRKQIVSLPLSFNWIFFNLVIFSCIAFGNSRYFEVLNIFFILLCVLYALKVLILIFSCQKHLNQIKYVSF